MGPKAASWPSRTAVICVGVAGDEIRIVGDDDHSGAAAVEFVEEREQRVGAGAILAERGLVEHEDGARPAGRRRRAVLVPDGERRHF